MYFEALAVSSSQNYLMYVRIVFRSITDEVRWHLKGINYLRYGRLVIFFRKPISAMKYEHKDKHGHTYCFLFDLFYSRKNIIARCKQRIEK